MKGTAMEQNKAIEKYCNDLIMNMNAFRQMDPEEKKKDMCYGAFLTAFLIVIPMIVMIIFMVLEKHLWGILISAASVAFALFYGLSRRKQIIRSFYQNENGADLVDLEQSTGNLQEAADNTRCIAANLPAEKEIFNLIYNWLCNRKLLDNGERLRIIRAGHDDLSGLVDPQYLPAGDVLLIMTPEREPDSWQRVRLEMNIMQMVFLLNLMKKEDTAEKEEKPEYSGEWSGWVTK